MKVIFVASGNKTVGTVSAFVRSQYESLKKEGLEMILFPIKGKGWKHYAKGILHLRKLIRKEHPEIVHAHYSVCGIVAAIASIGFSSKVVVSILGSFPRKTFKLYWVRFFVKYVWDATITKSQRTSDQLGIRLPVIPNGVNLSQFTIVDKNEARIKLGLSKEKKYIIFVSDPARKEKNFSLAEDAVRNIQDDNVVLLPVFNRKHDDIVIYMCAADVLVLTSLNEGSPNVIKEAMACNCPIVSTDVGDVAWVTGGVDGTYVSHSFDTSEITNLLKKSLSFNNRTNGREKLISLGLTVENIAFRIIEVYSSIVAKTQ